ncbi:LLM class flavin-dependent oxidoreductase [Micromonospora coriariae]|uniref:LLM class flavin-dependent oxidoreductase n=1 Tax=Micromonospora coriariae TaxID=285665 RepID=UPI002F91B5FF
MTDPPAPPTPGATMAELGWAQLALVAWLATGLATAAVFVTRGGHRNLLWYLVGGLPGPLLVPIAVERGRAAPQRFDVRFRAPAPTRPGLRVLVGLDGSPDSDRALRAVAHALTGTTSELVLVTVTDPDLVDLEADAERQRARRMLDEVARTLPDGLGDASTEIVAGHPADAILAVADVRDVDLLVIGRLGHGLDEKLLGNVAEDLAHAAAAPSCSAACPARKGSCPAGSGRRAAGCGRRFRAGRAGKPGHPHPAEHRRREEPMPVLGFHASHEQFPPSALLRLVEAARAAGFTRAMCSDHFAPFGAEQGHSGFAWSWLGAALARTDLPLGVVNAPGQRYHPAIVAQAAATLTEMFPGRFWLALGSGQALNEHITGARWPATPERNARLRECVQVIRALFAGECVDHRGLVTVDRAVLWSRPAQPPPVYAAAVTRRPPAGRVPGRTG